MLYYFLLIFLEELLMFISKLFLLKPYDHLENKKMNMNLKYLAFLNSSSIIKSTVGLSTFANFRLFIIADFNL